MEGISPVHGCANCHQWNAAITACANHLRSPCSSSDHVRARILRRVARSRWPMTAAKSRSMASSSRAAQSDITQPAWLNLTSFTRASCSLGTISTRLRSSACRTNSCTAWREMPNTRANSLIPTGLARMWLKSRFIAGVTAPYPLRAAAARTRDSIHSYRCSSSVRK